MSIAVLKIMIIFALIFSDQCMGSELAQHSKGFFYCPQYNAVVCFRPERETLCKDLRAEMATVFNLATLKKLHKMNNSLFAIQAMHQANRPELIQKLLFKSKDQLIRELLIELNAKNRVYYFILESGLIDQFHTYCREEER